MSGTKFAVQHIFFLCLKSYFILLLRQLFYIGISHRNHSHRLAIFLKIQKFQNTFLSLKIRHFLLFIIKHLQGISISLFFFLSLSISLSLSLSLFLPLNAEIFLIKFMLSIYSYLIQFQCQKHEQSMNLKVICQAKCT